MGTVREVVYLGPDTRYIVALELGGELVVTQQNLRDIIDGGADCAGPAGTTGLEAAARIEPGRQPGDDGGKRERHASEATANSRP